MRIYTRRGDAGKTSLLFGGRVSKDDPRCEAYGALDEAVSILGLARALTKDRRVRLIVGGLQRELFTVGAELATDASQHERVEARFGVVSPEMTAALEVHIDALTAKAPLPREFIVPGGSAASAALDVARTVVRRAERRVVGLRRRGMLPNAEVLRYLNRLSDLLFVLARYEDRARPLETVRAKRTGAAKQR